MCLCVSLFLLFAGGLLLWFRCHSYQTLDNLVPWTAPLKGEGSYSLPADFANLQSNCFALAMPRFS